MTVGSVVCGSPLWGLSDSLHFLGKILLFFLLSSVTLLGLLWEFALILSVSFLLLAFTLNLP